MQLTEPSQVPADTGNAAPSRKKRRSRVALEAMPAIAARPEGSKRADLERRVTEVFGKDIGGSGVTINALIAQGFAKGMAGETNFTDVLDAAVQGALDVADGKLGNVEKMLHGQLVGLNAIFGECVRRGGLNMGSHLDAAETYMRLGLKAQAQCARTAEVLGNLRAGPTVFARQANITTGPQQVNNGAMPASPAPVQKPRNPTNELLEDATDVQRQRMEPGAPAAPARGDSTLAPVGEVDRPANARG